MEHPSVSGMGQDDDGQVLNVQFPEHTVLHPGNSHKRAEHVLHC